MDIKPSNLQTPTNPENSRSTGRADNARYANNTTATRQNSPVQSPNQNVETNRQDRSASTTDEVSISQQALQTANTERQPAQEPNIAASEIAQQVVSAVVSSIQQNPQQALDSADALPRDTISAIISSAPTFTQPAETERAPDNANQISESVSENPVQAINSQANVDANQVSELV